MTKNESRVYLADNLLEEQSKVIEWLSDGPKMLGNVVESIVEGQETDLARALRLMVDAEFVVKEEWVDGALYRFAGVAIA